MSPYENTRSRNSISPRIEVRLKPDTTYGAGDDVAAESDAESYVVSAFRRTASAIEGLVSRTSNMRFHDAMPRWSMLVTQPNAIIGQLSIVRYELNATNSPTDILPRTTSLPPSQRTSSAPRPRKNDMLGKKNPCRTISRRLRRRYSSFDRRKRSSSACSWRYARTTRTPDSDSCATALTSESCA